MEPNGLPFCWELNVLKQQYVFTKNCIKAYIKIEIILSEDNISQ